MISKLAPALLITALASCGAGEQANSAKDSPMNDSTTVAQFTVSSPDIRDGQPIDTVYTCDGADQSPQIEWPEAPPGTKSFALVMDDPDAPNGTFRHWAAYDIPDTQTSIERGAGNSAAAQFKQATNDFGKTGYGGPCPPKGHGPHHYHFKLYALDVDGLTVPADASVKQVEDAARQHIVAKAQITGTYERE